MNSVQDRRTSLASIDDVDDRRVAIAQRRKSARTRTLKVAQLVWAGGQVACAVRNLSRTGACLQVGELIPDRFDLIFDCDKSRYQCVVIWRNPCRTGVKFL
jgi:hypothetical protein